MKAISDGVSHSVVLTTFSMVSKQSEGGEHPTRDPLVSLERQRVPQLAEGFGRIHVKVDIAIIWLFVY